MAYDMKVRRSIDAKPSIVFDTWTDAVAQRVLFANDSSWTVEAECDLRVAAVGT